MMVVMTTMPIIGDAERDDGGDGDDDGGDDESHSPWSRVFAYTSGKETSRGGIEMTMRIMMMMPVWHGESHPLAACQRARQARAGRLASRIPHSREYSHTPRE